MECFRIGRILEKAAMKRENRASAVIAAMYAVVGASWIYFSDNWILLRLLQISQFVILNRVKDLFLILQKQILRSAQNDRIRETDFCKRLYC